jgi:HAD superfamily hydrolase (TIGR01549 family)
MANIAVGFDFDHTLGIDNRLEKTTALDMLAALAARHGAAYDVEAAERAMDEVLAAYRGGKIPSLEGAVAGFFERFVPAGPDLLDESQAFREQTLARAPQHVQVLPGVAEMFAQLDALGVRYAILTNGWSPLQEEKARLIDFREPVYVSERIGARKPERAAFDVLAKYFALPFESIWYVGDDPAVDCAGARALGLTSVWFDWENRTYPSDVAPPDHVIHKLLDLPPLLQGYVKGAANVGA